MKLDDPAGSSIILALVFFLMCAIIGSIVLTAASVNSKSTATYEEMQQLEYTVTSAADLVGSQIVGSEITWAYPSKAQDAIPNFMQDDQYETCSEFLKALWKKYGSVAQESGTGGIWDTRGKTDPYTLPETFTVQVAELQDVQVNITFDRDLNIEASLSVSDGTGGSAGYDEVVSVHATPHFDLSGRLVSVSWDSYTVAKASSLHEAAPQVGGAS